MKNCLLTVNQNLSSALSLNSQITLYWLIVTLPASFILKLFLTPSNSSGLKMISVQFYAFPYPIFNTLISLPTMIKVLITIILIAPLAFYMGMPFPLGLSILRDKEHYLIPWAWGINGCASVISAIVATLLALHFGFSLVIFVAVLFYCCAALLLIKKFIY